MNWRRLSLLLFVICCAGCVIAPERVNSDCAWSHDPAARVDTGSARDERHLRDDVTVAEELAIRYADARRGFRSGQYVGPREYGLAREQCLTKLVDEIATNHHVDAGHVQSLIQRRSVVYDIGVVFLPMGLSFCAAASFAVRWIQRRFASDEIVPRGLSLVGASVVLDLVGYLAGSVWSFLSEEEVRLHTNHLSYRAFYLPWSRHPIVVLAIGLLLFWAIVFVRLQLVEPVMSHSSIEGDVDPRSVAR